MAGNPPLHSRLVYAAAAAEPYLGVQFLSVDDSGEVWQQQLPKGWCLPKQSVSPVLAQYWTAKVSFQNALELRSIIPFEPSSKSRSTLKDRRPHRLCFPLCASSTGRNHIQLKFDDDYPHDPTVLDYCKKAIRNLRVLFMFLLEQPGQLKYLEWPSFPSTLKTASLTLILVALLIVVLSSVDSLLSLLLALVLRRKA